MRRQILPAALLLIPCAVSLPAKAYGAKQQTRTATLVDQLQKVETSDKATEELLRLSKLEPETRKALAVALPAIIAKGPNSQEGWHNAVKLAATLKVVEAIPSLVKWMDYDGSSFILGGLGMSPNQFPAAWALIQIGDPSVPALAAVLAGPDQQTPRQADHRKQASIETLQQLGTPAARKALEEALPHQTDDRIVQEIKQSLRTMPRRSPTSAVPQ
ncbi:MAG: HEAT repeat domain-containing protein [Terriglobia bacterium]|jgi:HEAT repeat protein